MVPLLGKTTVDGKPIEQLINEKELNELVQRTRDGGAEIVALLKTGSAFYAPAFSILEILEAIVGDSKKPLPVSCFLQGEYGLKDLFIGIPAKIGGKGIEEIQEIELNAEEKAALMESASAIKKSLESAK